jgi:hypothetical protein
VFEVGIHHVSRPLYTLPVAQAAAAIDSVSAPFNKFDTETSYSGILAASADVVQVPQEVGLVHHYRNCVIAYDVEMNCNPAAFVVDDRLERLGFALPLKTRINRTLDMFMKLQHKQSLRFKW